MYTSTREYSAEVVVNGRAVTEVRHNSEDFIEGRPGTTYSLRFYNNTLRRVLIIPAVDGLNVIDGKPCGVKSPGYVVNACGSIDIPGWKVDGSTAAEFEFRKQGEYYTHRKTYVEAMGEDKANQGTIGFMVFPEKPIVHTYNYHYPWHGPVVGSGVLRGSGTKYGSTSMGSSANATWTANSATLASASVEADLGTGFGQATAFATTAVNFERENEDTPAAILVFRYNTLQNLKKMGVPVERFSQSWAQSGPNPFPASPHLGGCRKPPGW